MKLGIIKRILKDDLAKSGDIPAWMDALLTPINEFIEKVGLALQNRLTFTDNLLCKVVSQVFASGTTYQINPQRTIGTGTLKPWGVLMIDPGGLVVSKFGWSLQSNGNIAVTTTFDGGGSATCKILILFG